MIVIDSREKYKYNSGNGIPEGFKLEIKGQSFYVLKCASAMYTYTGIDEAVGKLKESCMDDDAEILKFAIDNNKWSVSPVSWREISRLLIKG